MDDKKYANLSKIQKHQLNTMGNKNKKINKKIEDSEQKCQKNKDMLEKTLEEVDNLLKESNLSEEENSAIVECNSKFGLSKSELKKVEAKIETIDFLIKPEVTKNMSWEEFELNLKQYAIKKDIDLTTDPYKDLLSQNQINNIIRSTEEEFQYNKVDCDKYDYLISSFCGVLGGLIDVLFVSIPGDSKLTNFSDEQFNKIVEEFAKLNGWEHNRDSNSTNSAIRFLERKFKVNYDHRHGGDVDRVFKMSTNNHHIKSLAHSPSIVGLIFSIINQLTNTASFVDEGKITTIETETMELYGETFAAKLFCGFINWIGHIMSDVAGSSEANGRGNGIPIPLYELLQFINIGNFGENRDTFAKVAVKVFKEGYDFRHGVAMAIPVLFTEVSIRTFAIIKQKYTNNYEWLEAYKTINSSNIQRMLLVGHGCLVLVDFTDATIRSGGVPVAFFLRTNIIGWIRFAHLGYKECIELYRKKGIDIEKLEKHLNSEMKKIYDEIDDTSYKPIKFA